MATKQTDQKDQIDKKEEKTTEVKKTKKAVPAKKAETKTKKTAPKKTEVKEVKAETKKTPAKKTKAPQTMEELLASSDKPIVVPKRNQVVQGTVTSKGSRLLTVDIGAKTEGIVADKDYDIAREFLDDLKVGDEIEATVISTENSRGQIVLSLKDSAIDAQWDFFREALDESKELEVKGVDVNKGGLIVEINNLHGFVPSSQFSKDYIGTFKELVGKKVKVLPIEVDQEKNRLIFSERHVSEADELALREDALESVKEESIYSGVVSGVMPFGLFVTVEVPVGDKDDKDKKDDVGFVEGLIHISEISWEKVNHPRDYHKVGDEIKVKVLGIDERTNKLNLSLKQLTDDPWQKVAEDYPVGTTFTGKVSRIEPFGVFVNVAPGVDGLIHASKLGDQAFKEEDEVTVTVESVEPDQRRMSLSAVTTSLPVGYK
jgi:ribosomal protein S1